MEAIKTQHPFYVRLSLTLFALVLLGAIVYVGRDIIVPLLFGVLLSTLLLPVTAYLRRKHVPKVLAITAPVVLAVVVIGGIVYLLSNQILHFVDDIPALKERVNELSHSMQSWLDQSAHIDVQKQNQYINQAVEGIKDKGPQLVGRTFVSITEVITYIILLPIYTFLMLFHKDTIKTFLIGVFRNGSEQRVREVLHESSTIAQKYVGGLLIETTIVFTLNAIGFLILGIKYAVFLALLAALLNLIPFVGMLVANIICMVITLVTSESAGDVLWVGVILAAVQLFDNNVGMPMIVGNKVRINALVTIVGVFVGGALCGVPGMFLAIPALAVMKTIFDKVPDMLPWGILLGDDCPDTPAAQRAHLDLIKGQTPAPRKNWRHRNAARKHRHADNAHPKAKQNTEP